MAGALAFFLSRALVPEPAVSSAPPEERRIVVDATRIRGLKRDYALANRAAATEPELRALVDKLVVEEMLFREAIARGFEMADRSIGWRLVQKMRYLGEDAQDDVPTLYRRALEMGLHKSDPVVRRILVEKIRLIIGHAAAPPTDAEIEEWYAAHQQDYRQAARVTFRHVFFDRGRRGDEDSRGSAEGAAVAAQGKALDAARSFGGDPFVMGTELRSQGKADLTKLFGPRFAEEVLSLPEGGWSAPIESTYGWHLVWIEQRFEPRVPALAEVRSRVIKSLEAERRAKRVDEFLARIRRDYAIEVDEQALREIAHG